MNIDHLAYYEIKLTEESLSYYISKNKYYNINKDSTHYHPKMCGLGCFWNKYFMHTKAAFIWSKHSKNSNTVKYYYNLKYPFSV